MAFDRCLIKDYLLTYMLSGVKIALRPMLPTKLHSDIGVKNVVSLTIISR